MDTLWQFWIDRGGTFTDCIGVSPQGEMHAEKILSSATSPIDGIRNILGLDRNVSIPPCEVRMGTTLATNALLERQGPPTALVISEGFRDLLSIGTQARSDLFALDIVKPEMVYQEVVEVSARHAIDGSILCRPEDSILRHTLSTLKERGIESLAVVVLHSYKNQELEFAIREVALEIGFANVAISSEVSCEIGMLARGETTVVDAYLTPVLSQYMEELKVQLPGSKVWFMQSSGGLCHAERFRGKNAILSGPAGGVIAYSRVARDAGLTKAIGFDMGGTSTDVSCFEGRLDRQYETEIAGVRVRTPMLNIHTVAAGGGSICEDNGFRFSVGPQSVGAQPGPLCYGNPGSHQLSVTDCNLAVGRIVGDHFPFPLKRKPVCNALQAIADQLATRGIPKDPFDIASGFIEIANANMAAAIREVTVAKGRDLGDFAMIVLGGAGGQHACAVARQVGIRTLVLHSMAGVLSAYGMGMAQLSWHGQADTSGCRLTQMHVAMDQLAILESRGRAFLQTEGVTKMKVVRRLDARYLGTDAAITIELRPDVEQTFRDEHERLYGYTKDVEIEIVAVRIEVVDLQANDRTKERKFGGSGASMPLRTHKLWSEGRWNSIPVYTRDALCEGTTVAGPAMILDTNGTTCVDRGWIGTLESGGCLVLRDSQSESALTAKTDVAADPVRLEIFSNIFMSIAVQMGNVLRDTAVSTNIRERLDYSCAVFDPSGGLVANAPHIPVHLGAMGESIRGILSVHPEPEVGAVYASNDPALGGSHLPDITVVTPVHDNAGRLIFFTASRGHHADVGGRTPGSMPPFSRTLDDEGVVFRAVPIVRNGVFDEAGVIGILTDHLHPARCIADNLSDLQAQIAANRCGVGLLEQLLVSRGADVVHAYMAHVQDNAADQVLSCIVAMPHEDRRFVDFMDDGTRIEVCVSVRASKLIVDFSGTGPQVDGNLNAPKAVTIAAVMYVLRTMIGAKIPLNSGCLRHVDIRIPFGTILNPILGSAIAAGNVETSQRVVDVLLGSFGLCAAAQGTMNNLSFGHETLGYYETIAGGAGATANRAGASAVHTHMTNTRITDPEIFESRYPVRLIEFSIRKNSGGRGARRGGDGLVREFEALTPLDVSIISERRKRAPFGLEGGEAGAMGVNKHNGVVLPGNVHLKLATGQRIRIETPGGGGHGPDAN